MKKVLTIAIAAALCLTMLACSKKTEEPAAQTKKSNDTTETTITSDTKETDPEEDYEKDPEDTSEAEDTTDPEEEEPEEKEKYDTDYDFSSLAGLYSYNDDNSSIFITVDDNGNWEMTTGGEDGTNGYIAKDNKSDTFYAIIEGEEYQISVKENGSIEIMGMEFVPYGSNQGSDKEADVSALEGTWYLNGDSNSGSYYRINANGGWTFFMNNDMCDSGYTVADADSYTFVNDIDASATNRVDYDEANNTITINGDNFVNLEG